MRVDARPEHIGPGYWDALHQWAYVHDTSTIPQSREMFIDNVVRGTGGHFKCMECRGHAIEYMTKTDPVENILKQPRFSKPGDTDGKPLMVCLAWTYRFHEAVNTRLKKLASQRPTFSQLESFLADLREGKGCHNCGPIGVSDLKPPMAIIMQRLMLD